MNTLFNNEVTLLWPRNGVFIRAHRVKWKANQLSASACCGEGAGNTPTEWLFLPHYSWAGGTGMPWSKHTYNLDHANHKALFTKWTLKIESFYLWSWLSPLPLPVFLQVFCMFPLLVYSLLSNYTQRKRAGTHDKNFISVCAILQWYFQYRHVLFCSR